MKKFLALILSLVMVLALAACGGSNDKPADTSEPASGDLITVGSINYSRIAENIEMDAILAVALGGQRPVRRRKAAAGALFSNLHTKNRTNRTFSAKRLGSRLRTGSGFALVLYELPICFYQRRRDLYKSTRINMAFTGGTYKLFLAIQTDFIFVFFISGTFPIYQREIYQDFARLYVNLYCISVQSQKKYVQIIDKRAKSKYTGTNIKEDTQGASPPAGAGGVKERKKTIWML